MTEPTRRELLQSALDHVRRTGDPALPWDEVPGLATELGEPNELLRELHRRWYARFAAQLDALLEDQPSDLPEAVEKLWLQLTADDPAWRMVLDAHRTHPALADAEERQRRLLERATLGELSALPRIDPQDRTLSLRH